MKRTGKYFIGLIIILALVTMNQAEIRRSPCGK